MSRDGLIIHEINGGSSPLMLGTWDKVETYNNAAHERFVIVSRNWRKAKRLYKRYMWRVPGTGKSNGSNKSLHTMERVLCIPKGKRKPWQLNRRQ